MSLLHLLLHALFLPVILSIPFTENDLRYVGRFDHSREFPSADWSGSGVTFFVKASSSQGNDMMVDVSLTAHVGAVSGSDEMLYYVGVLVNCEFLATYPVSADDNSIEFSFSSSKNSVDEIHVIKLTEGMNLDAQGELALTGYSLSDNALMVSQDVANNFPKTCRNPNNLNLLIVGDSITAAYGVDGVNPCSYSAETQNIMHSYAYLTAEALGAEFHSIAWSGKGVVRNYGDANTTSENPMPDLYNRTLAPLSTADASENYWNPSGYTPDVVLVMLGSNDYSTTPNPSDEDFVNGLVDFLNLLKSDYPQAIFAAMCAPSNHGNQCVNIESATKITNSHYVGMDASLYVSPDGCDSHPSAETQQNIADVVVPAVQEILKSSS